MTERDDPLWNPDLTPDAELARLQRLLSPYGARAATQVVPQHLVQPSRGKRRWRYAALAMAASLAFAMVAGHHYRLAWTPGAHWTVTQLSPGARSEATLAPGQDLATGNDETARVNVARIGHITLSPRSRLRLLETASGRHGVALEHGHLRARIWAPPGYFSVEAGDATVVDLGCDFELWQAQEGTGRVLVRSGWISYRIGNEDILVMADHDLKFVDGVAHSPMRTDASAALRDEVRRLEALLRRDRVDDAAGLDRTASRVAALARDADAFTLLSLLSRWPALARTTLYSRLAVALGQVADEEAHRSAWAAGDQAAMDTWWNTLPSQPKQWWGGWKDLL